MTDRRLRIIQGSSKLGEEILALLDDTTIELRFGDAGSWREQLLGIAFTDLLGRLFPRIAFVGAAGVVASSLLPPGPEGLEDRLQEARSHGIPPQNPGSSPQITIGIGQATDQVTFYCDADNWQSYIGPSASQLEAEQETLVPIGPIAAACRAAARAYALVLAPVQGVTLPPLSPVYSCALTYTSTNTPIEAPEGLPPVSTLGAVLAGVGSVGGAAVYTWARLPRLTGALELVDYQELEDHNPDRALLATQEASEAHLEKVQVAADTLAHHTELDTVPHHLRFSDWLADRSQAEPLPLMLSAFDSVDARRELQDALPLDVINAACGADRIVVSGHVTDDGPCLYCLHIADVLDTRYATLNVIAQATGMPPKTVQGLLEQHTPLTPQHITGIERYRHLVTGALQQYVGRGIDELYRAELRYAETAISRGEDRAAVAATFVTALAGVLLAGEALKAGTPEYHPYRLGPFHAGRTKYEENLLASPANALVIPVERWAGTECLCRSTRRLRLLRERYGARE